MMRGRKSSADTHHAVRLLMISLAAPASEQEPSEKERNISNSEDDPDFWPREEVSLHASERAEEKPAKRGFALIYIGLTPLARGDRIASTTSDLPTRRLHSFSSVGGFAAKNKFGAASCC